jgi:hypothetical protein
MANSTAAPTAITSTASTACTASTDPTIRIMIVCVPEGLPGEVFDRRQLDRQFGVQGSIVQRFWAKQPCRRWHRPHLVDPRKGQPTPCAGGPLRLLDLDALRRAYGLGAAIRHQTFTTVVRGTRDARPWVAFVQKHSDDPSKYPRDAAEADFNNQPRVLAIRAHNAVTYTTGQLDVHELEMFQAGPVAYQNYQYLTAVVADAVLTPDGERMQPATARMADRLTYLQQANRHLDTLDEDSRIIAVLV